jgi:hypothetical protein
MVLDEILASFDRDSIASFHSDISNLLLDMGYGKAL